MIIKKERRWARSKVARKVNLVLYQFCYFSASIKRNHENLSKHYKFFNKTFTNMLYTLGDSGFFRLQGIKVL